MFNPFYFIREQIYYSLLRNKIQNVEVSDTTGDAISTVVGVPKISTQNFFPHL